MNDDEQRTSRAAVWIQLVPHSQSALLEAALKKATVPVTFYTVNGGGHGGFNDPRIGQLVTEFLAQRLRATATR